MPRFVVLRHEPGPAGPRELHWDLMLERETDLLTWALDSEPVAGASIAALELPAHRKHYLDYEGPVSGERGSVTQFASGTYVVTQDAEDEWRITLSSEQLNAAVVLTRVADQRWAVVVGDA